MCQRAIPQANNNQFAKPCINSTEYPTLSFSWKEKNKKLIPQEVIQNEETKFRTFCRCQCTSNTWKLHHYCLRSDAVPTKISNWKQGGGSLVPNNNNDIRHPTKKRQIIIKEFWPFGKRLQDGFYASPRTKSHRVWAVWVRNAGARKWQFLEELTSRASSLYVLLLHVMYNFLNIYTFQ